MSIFTISAILVLFSNILIGILFFVKVKRKDIASNIGWTCFASAFWALGAWCFTVVQSKELAIFWIRIAHIGIILTPAFFFHFVLKFTDKYNKKFIGIIYVLAMLFIACTFFYKDFFEVRYVFNKFYFWSAPIYSHILYFSFYFIFYWVALLYSFFLLVREFAKSVGVKRNQLKYFILAMIIAWSGPEGMFLLVFGIPVYPASNFLIAIYPIVFAYAILRYRLLDINIALTRAGIFLAIYTLILGLPFLLAFKYGFWPLSLVLMALLATLGPIGYRYLQKRAEDYLLAEQRRYQNILKQAAKGMSTERNLKKLLKLIVYLVAKTVKISSAVIFLIDEQTGIYQLRAVRDHSNILKGISFKKENPLIVYLSKRKDPVLVEELPPELRAELGNKSENGLIVQSFTGDKLLGFMLLGEKKNAKMYSNDDIETFTTLSLQSAMAIENCMFVEELKENQGRIFAAEKLAAIGGMADGVAHQMRNKLNIFSVVAGTQQFSLEDLLTDYAEYFSKNENAKKRVEEVLLGTKTIQENVKKTADMINGILNFAKSDAKSNMFADFSLSKVVESSTKVIETKHQIAELPIEVDYGKDDSIYGVEIQIRECVYNILDNAYEAIKEKIDYYLKGEEKTKFIPRISFKLKKTTDKCILEFEDNGIGIKDEHKNKIFSPFFTTKPSVHSGAGIGMYVVKRMIAENHKGKIDFDSQYGVGTKIIIEIPNKQTD